MDGLIPDINRVRLAFFFKKQLQLTTAEITTHEGSVRTSVIAPTVAQNGPLLAHARRASQRSALPRPRPNNSWE